MKQDLSAQSTTYIMLNSDRSWPVLRDMALKDLCDGLRMYKLAFTLGCLDIKLRYRGSVLGPFWLTLSTALMIISMGLLYADLFHISVTQYLPHLAVALILWNTINSMVIDACTCFISAGTIHAIRLPFSLYCFKVLVRNAFIFLHNAVVILAIFLFFDIWPYWNVLISIVGAIIWILDAYAACLLLGAICARFRDVPPIIASVMQIAFFLTPVIWEPELIGKNIVYLVLNPFYPLLSIVKDPLLNHPPGGLIWAFALLWSVTLWTASYYVFATVRRRIAFWV